MSRTTAFALVSAVTQALDSGHRVVGGAAPSTLYSGPVHASGPSRSWEKVEALEGRFDLRLHVETRADLRPAREVILSKSDGGTLDGAYEVITVAGSAGRWSLALGRRAIDAA